jgi:hypothetical protein
LTLILPNDKKIGSAMATKKIKAPPSFGKIKTTAELGTLVRAFRKNANLTLEKVAGMCNLSMRFLSELERGKETAEIGKALMLLNNLGLEIVIQPRGYQFPKKMNEHNDA